MRTSSILVATAALFSTFAVAEADRPKFYFPRQVKRVVNNGPGQYTPQPRAEVPAQEQEKRATGFFGALADVLTNDGIFPTALAGTGRTPTTTPAPQSTAKLSLPLSAPEIPSAALSSKPASSSASSSDNILLGPGGIIPSLLSPLFPSTTAASIPVATAPSEAGSSAPPSAPSAPPAVSSAAPTASSGGGLLDPLLSALLPSSAPAPSSPASSASGPAATPADILPLPSMLSSLLANSESGLVTNTNAPATTANATVPEATPVAPSATPTNTGLLDPLIGGLSSLLAIPSVTPSVTDSIPLDTLLPTATASLSVPVTNLLPTLTGSIDTSIPTSTPTLIPIPTESVNSTIILPTTTDNGTVSAPPTNLPSVTAPIVSVNVTSSASDIITSPPTLTPTPVSSAPALPTEFSNNGTSTNGTGSANPEAAPSTTPASLSSDSTAIPTITAGPSETSKAPQQTILPTGTGTLTEQWIPSSIIVPPPSSETGSKASASATATGIPTTIPQVISNPSAATPETSVDMTLVQIGFLEPLNYLWVVQSSMTAVQIFAYTPIGVAGALNVPRDQVYIQSLVPLDTQSTNGYVTTLAMMYIPSSQFDALQAAMTAPKSLLFTNPSPSVAEIMNYIDTSIPLRPGSYNAGGSIGGGAGAGSGSGSGGAANNGNVFSSESQSQSPATKGTTVGIAVGAIGAAAAYGAAMFFIARRYKKKRSAHRRADSQASFGNTGPMMSKYASPALQGGSAVMSGGRNTPGFGGYDRNSQGSGKSNGNSVRTAGISAPMAAENSLGWN